MGCVVSLVRIHLAGGEYNRLRSLAFVLHKDSSYSKIRCVGGDSEGKVRVRNAKDRGFGHASF